MFLYDSIYEIIKTREEMAEVLFTVKEVRELKMSIERTMLG